MPIENLEGRTDAVRHFNRFYTRQIGLLQEGLLDTPFSLTEARVPYELAHRDRSTATEIGTDLGLDDGYMSRILKSFEERTLIEKTSSESDRRESLLTLTKRGRKVFAPLEARSKAHVKTLLANLPEAGQRRLIGAMETVQGLLGKPLETARSSPEPYRLRPHQPGDMGWVVHRHGVLYAREYGYDETFEALVAEIVAKFIRHQDAKRERCWIAEREDQISGSVFLIAESKTVAKLRLLLVEPSARGLGIGTRLVAECVRFARRASYKKILLWTQDELDAARHLYKKAGFQVVEKKHHHSFGKDLTAETWELTL